MTKNMKTGVAAVATLTLTAMALTLAPTTARADENVYSGETYCGTVLSGASPAEDPFAALSDMSNDFYDDLFQRAGGARELCGPYHWLIEQGAQAIVKKHTPAWLNHGLDIIDATNNSGQSTPTTIPAVGPVNVTGSVSWTDGLGLWLRGGPGGAASTILIMPEGTELVIECQSRGETIYGPSGPTDLWNRVTYNGTTGYASDAYMFTGSDGQVASSC